MKIEDSVLSIADNYETIFVDLYGVLYDGVALFSKTLPTLKRLKEKNKKVVLLSNMTMLANEAKIKYEKMGMLQNEHYDEVVTSGEFVHRIISDTPEKFSELIGGKAETYRCMFMINTAIMEKTCLQEVDAKDADFIYIGLPRSSYGAVRIDDVYNSAGEKINIEDVISADWSSLQDSQGRKGFWEFERQLEYCLRLNKTMMIANPDIFSRSSQKDSNEPASIITQGGIGAYYEKMGGKVVYFGKPYAGIFEYAQETVDCKGPIVMVGDAPWTDIAGANACGLDSALVVSTGVAGEFMKNMDNSLSADDKCRILFEEITPKMTKLKGRMEPNHFIKSFADKRYMDQS